MRRNALIAGALSAGMFGPAYAAAPSYVEPSTRRTVRSRKGELPAGFIPASINRHTGKPHEHRREIARRLARSAKVVSHV